MVITHTMHAKALTRFSEKYQRGLTLIELLVTVAIFTMVSLILTSSLMSLLAVKSQINATQQGFDSVRLIVESMELELRSGSEYNVSDCTGGVCSSISFTVVTRPELNPHNITYRLVAGKIEKGIQRNDGVCDTLPLPGNCFFPVTPANTTVTFLNFDVEAPTESSFSRPIVTISLQGTTLDEQGSTVPFEYGTTLGPRTIQDSGTYSPSADLVQPDIDWTSLSGPGGCGFWTNEARTTPFNINSLINNQDALVFTDCDSVDVGFSALDTYSGIRGARWDLDIPVDGGNCNYGGFFRSDCDLDVFSISPSLFGQSPVSYTINAVPLRPGIGRTAYGGIEQQLTIQVMDTSPSENVRSTSIGFRHIGNPNPPTTAGMLDSVRLYCAPAATPKARVLINITPVLGSQRQVRVFRCSAADANGCDPMTGTELSVLVSGASYPYILIADPFRYEYNGILAGNNNSPTIFDTTVNELQYYTYGFLVEDPYTGDRSAIRVIDWGVNSRPPGTIFPFTASYMPAGYCDTGAVGGVDLEGGQPPDPTNPVIPTTPTYSFDLTRTGYFRVSISGAPGGSEWTSAVTVAMTGTGLPPTATLAFTGITGGPGPLSAAQTALIQFGATRFSLTPTNNSAIVRIRVPTDLPKTEGAPYFVNLTLTNGAQVEDVQIPLIVSQNPVGPQ